MIGSRFFPYANGGGYSKYANDIVEYIDYEDNGRVLKEDAKQKYGSASRTIKNVNYFFRSGITYSPIGGNTFSARKLPPNCIFSDKGPCIFSSQINELFLLGYANSKLFNYFIKLLNPTVGFAIADIERVPFKIPKKVMEEKVVDIVERIVSEKEFVIGFDKKSDFFHETELQYGFNQKGTTIEEAYKIYRNKYLELCNETYELQCELDKLFYDFFDMSDAEKSVIEESIIGKIIDSEDMCSIERSCLNYLRFLVFFELSETGSKLYIADDLVTIVRNKIERTFDNGYQIIEEIENILHKNIFEIISVGAKVDGAMEKFAGTSTNDFFEPLLLSKKIAGSGKSTINVYWLSSEFLLEYEDNKKYAMQNEIRRLTDEVYLPKLQRAKEKMQESGLSGVERKKLEKELALYEECVKTLENWKVVD